MLDIVIKSFEWLWRLLTFLTPPIAVEVHRLCYDEMTNAPGDSVVVITPHPRRYFCELSLTNRRSTAVSVRHIGLVIGQLELSQSRDRSNLRLETHERTTMKIIFPVGDNQVPVEEVPFSIIVDPAVGRRTVVKDVLPIV